MKVAFEQEAKRQEEDAKYKSFRPLSEEEFSRRKVIGEEIAEFDKAKAWAERERLVDTMTSLNLPIPKTAIGTGIESAGRRVLMLAGDAMLMASKPFASDAEAREQAWKKQRLGLQILNAMNRGDLPGPVLKAVADVAEAGTLMTAGAVGGMGGTIGLFGSIAAGEAYMAMRNDGASDAVAYPVAILTGAAEGAIESITSVIPGIS